MLAQIVVAVRRLSFGALVPWVVVAQEPAPAPEPAPEDPVVATARERLAAVGYDVPASVRSEAREARQVLADLDAQQDLFVFEGGFDLQHALLTHLGLRAGADGDALRQAAIAEMARAFSAYYDPLRKAFVLLPSRTREVGEQVGGLLPLVVHELVHAHQDAREGGLSQFFAGARASFDRVLAHRCVLEGEAELVAFAALRGTDALAALTSFDTANALDRLFAGELNGAIYEAGRALALARHHAGGFAAVRGLWAAPPASTEQALYAEKFGQDVPTPVVVPTVAGLEPVHRSTIGELMMRNLLRQLGHDRLAAELAAAGWDGDELVLFARGEVRAAVLVWRSVWDRDEDAADFAARLGERGAVAVAGRVVDWVAADDAELRTAVAAALAADRPSPAAEAADADSTVRVEAALRAAGAASRDDGGTWRHDALGVAVPIADGFELKEINGLRMLVHGATAASGFATNVNVLAQPRGDLADLAALEALTRQQFAPMRLTIDAMAVERRGEVEVLAAEYHGRIGRSPALRFLALALLRGDQQIWITATVRESDWTDLEATLRTVMRGITIAPAR